MSVLPYGISVVADALTDTGMPNVSLTGGTLKSVLQLIFGMMGAIAVLIVMIGGFRYVMSEGNPESTKKARSTILYAIVGLIVAISAQVIVAFVLRATK